MQRLGLGLTVLLLGVTVSFGQELRPKSRKAEYVRAVTRGAGLMPWQEPGESEEERAFREAIERRKDGLLAHSGEVAHPAVYARDDLARARANAEASDWAKKWVLGHVSLADYIVGQPDGWIAAMIPEEPPGHGYGFTCPNCVGEQSQEAVGSSQAAWSYRDPDVLMCRVCGQTYPDAAFPETATLGLPRLGYAITYYLNEAERAAPEDRSGNLAWHWVGYPIHVSFSGMIRQQKIVFMRGAAQSLGFAYAFTGDVRYARAARDVLVRYAHCYRRWPYRDYWDTYADCDPMYAAWHDKSLPIEWKRHLCESAYKKDTVETAAMLQGYWGAGRVSPSTDGVSGLRLLVLAYDLTCEAVNEDGAPVWSAEDRRLVERDLILEYIMGAEPFVGGANKAENCNNKSPRVYHAMACVSKCLGIPAMADTALRGYERVRDGSFLYDGFSSESPGYNNMYLSQLLEIPEVLRGFVWPEGFEPRQGTVDCYANDPKLGLMYRAVLWTLLPSGQYLPLSDTHVHTPPSQHIVHKGLARYPDLYAGTMPRLSASTMDEYALFSLSQEALTTDAGLHLPETHFPAWRTAILRHGSSEDAATVALVNNFPGGHRHTDNLALFHGKGGRGVLGDLGYVGDMPMNEWIRSTKSHNLVVVDDSDQRFGERVPEFALMATSPLASVVEAASDAYAQCTEYRRRVVLIKGLDGNAFAVDLFRVSGGDKHAFRVYSEFAASDAENGGLAFAGVNMPPEPPLPEVGASLARADIYGLRDVRSATPANVVWQAAWRDASGAYRLWMAAPCDRVEASNGPGQRSRNDTGRRVRYVDAVREGQEIESTFIAVHEPSLDADTFGIVKIEPLDVPAAGPRAVALRVESAWGTYVVLNDFDQPSEVDGVRFQGSLAVLRLVDGALTDYMAVGATELSWNEQGFTDAVASAEGQVKQNDSERLLPESLPETGWPVIDPGTEAYIRVLVEDGWTGFPVAGVQANAIRVKDYPLPPVTAFELHSVRYSASE